MLDMAGKAVFYKGKKVDMTIKEYELLTLLISNKGKTLTKDYLFKDETLKDTKNSPCDLGKDKFNEIMREQLVEYNRGNNE